MNSFLCCLLLGIDTQWEDVKKMEPPTQLCTLKRQETRGGKQDIPSWYNEKKKISPWESSDLEQIVQLGCIILIFRDTENLTGQGLDYLL